MDGNIRDKRSWHAIKVKSLVEVRKWTATSGAKTTTLLPSA